MTRTQSRREVTIVRSLVGSLYFASSQPLTAFLRVEQSPGLYLVRRHLRAMFLRAFSPSFALSLHAQTEFLSSSQLHPAHMTPFSPATRRASDPQAPPSSVKPGQHPAAQEAAAPPGPARGSPLVAGAARRVGQRVPCRSIGLGGRTSEKDLGRTAMFFSLVFPLAPFG